MPWKDTLLNLLSHIWRWLRYAPGAPGWSIIVSIAVVLLCQAFGYHERAIAEIDRPWDVNPPTLVFVYDYLSPYLGLIAMLGSVVYFIQIIRVMPSVRRLVFPTEIASVMLAVWALMGEAHTYWETANFSYMGEPASVFAYILKVIFLLVIILSPPYMLLWYSRQKILDRFTLKNFLQPFIFCLFAFGSLWVLMDLLDNMKDFQQSNTPPGVVMSFYLNLLPSIYVFITPAALLLSVLYALTKMSRANEIVSMLTAGRSLWQVLRPVFIVSAYISFMGVAMNYHWAPRGEGRRDAALQAMSLEKKTGTSAAQASIMFRNTETNRTWFIGSMPFDPMREKIRHIQVRQTDDKGRLLAGWYGTSGRWWSNGLWSLNNGIKVTYDGKGAAVEMKSFEVQDNRSTTRIDLPGWPETPWSLISGSLLPDNLSVSELVSYLNANQTMEHEKLNAFRTHFWHRFAYPLQSLVLVLMAAPLGVSFSRRGALGGIAGSVFIFFGLLFLNNLFVSLGKGGHLPAFLAVWMPHLIIGSIGYLLFHIRSQNRDLPKLSPAYWLKQTWQRLQQLKARRLATA